MRGLFFQKHGSKDQLQFGEIPDPALQEGQALIDVKACALNHLDILVRRGWIGLKLNFPHVTGFDISGVISELSAEHPHFKPGDRVIVNPGLNLFEDAWTARQEHSVSPGYRMLGKEFPGGLAERVAVPIGNLKKIPDGVSFADAAAPILVAQTCWRMLFRRGAVQAGETALIVGSGGGVNSLCIPVLRKKGLQVIVLAGTEEKEERARDLGAHHTINYREVKNWDREVLKLTEGRGVEIVVDNVGKATMPYALRAAAPGGRILTVGNTSGPFVALDNRMIFDKQLSFLGSSMGSPEDFHNSMDFLWEHKIPPLVDRVFPLEQGQEAFEYLESGEHFGKILVQPEA